MIDRTTMQAQNPVMHFLSTTCVILGASCPIYVWLSDLPWAFTSFSVQCINSCNLGKCLKKNTVLVYVYWGHYQTPNWNFIKDIIFVLLRMETLLGTFHVSYCTVFLEHRLPWPIHTLLSSRKYLSQKMFIKFASHMIEF